MKNLLIWIFCIFFTISCQKSNSNTQTDYSHKEKNHQNKENNDNNLSSDEIDEVISEHVKTHILYGEVKNGKAKGGHSPNSLNKTIRWKKGTKIKDGALGMQMGYIEIKDKNDNWIAKKDITSLYPTDWSDEKILQEVVYAYKHKKKANPKSDLWEGKDSEGKIKIHMYVNNGKLATAFPILK